MTRQILEDDEQPAKIPGWALTNIDLLWLLLIFFILRSAVGEIGEGHHFREITAAFKKRFGVEAAAAADNGSGKKAAGGSSDGDRTQYGEILREGLDRAAAARKRSLAARGVIYFPDGEVELGSEQKQVLQAVAESIGHASETIEIRGESAEKNAAAGREGRPAADPAFARCAARATTWSNWGSNGSVCGSPSAEKSGLRAKGPA